MTSLEHVSVKHALDPLPSWTGNVGGDVSEVWDEVEEVGVGVAVTTTDDEEEEVGIAVERGSPRAENRNENENDQDDQERGPSLLHGGVGRSSRCASPLRSTSCSGSGSGSVSHSHSHSHSRSRSSVRVPLEMGESSAATSWTQAEGERPSGDSERRPSDEVRCRSSVDRTGLEEVVVDVGTSEEPRDGVEVVPLSHLSTTTDGTGRDVTRKEEVLVVQEEDIGETWHPLRYNGKARSQDGEEGEGEVEEDVGLVHALEGVRGGDQFSEANEKERWRTFGSSGRNMRHLRLEFKPPTPQPWEEIDPPTDNNEMYASDYYSTLNSKRFGTLQKSRRRPLVPHSSYYFGPPPPDSAFGTPPVGQIGVHHPREIVRIERDYVGGELIQFSPAFPLELEGRITPTQFHQTINDINEILISAHSIRHAFVDNLLAVATLQLSNLVTTSHYTKEMRRLKRKFEELNTQLYNPVGLHILWPHKVAFLFLEIEYY